MIGVFQLNQSFKNSQLYYLLQGHSKQKFCYRRSTKFVPQPSVSFFTLTLPVPNLVKFSAFDARADNLVPTKHWN